MFCFPAQARLQVWPFLAVLFLTALTLQGQSSTAPPSTTQIKWIRTIQPRDLRLTDRDRLSGGLPQRVPFRMATDSLGRILVTDPYLSLIHVFDIEGGRRFQLRGDSVHHMMFPTYIAVDGDDNIYVSEPMLGMVLVFSPDGKLKRSVGGAELTLPFGLAVDKAGHVLYVADHEGGAIRAYSLDGTYLKSIGARGAAIGELNHPTEVVFANNTLTVLDAGNARFQVFDPEGHSKAVLPFGDDKIPQAFAVDPVERIVCVDQLSLGVLVLDGAGVVATTFGERRPYGQPRSADSTPTYTALATRGDGAILALRPNLVVDVLRIETATNAAAGTPDSK